MLALVDQYIPGKTFFIRYALLRCLSEKQEAYYIARGHWYLFSARGVDCFSKAPEEFGRTQSGVAWVFIDSMEAKDGLPIDLTGDQSDGVFPIYTTSPESSRWKSLHQSKTRSVIYMNPWSWEEISIT
jgi:hypothetical protein